MTKATQHTSTCFLNLNVYFLSQLGKFSAICLQIYSLPLSLSLLLLGPYNVKGSMLDDVSKNVLKCSHLKMYIYIFSIQLEWFLPLFLPVHWSVPLYHLICYWFLLEYFNYYGLQFFLILHGFSLLTSHCARPFFSQCHQTSLLQLSWTFIG